MTLRMKTQTKSKSKDFVLDCSVTLAWCFPDEHAKKSQTILDLLDQATAIVPALWPIEVGNSLLMGERRKRSTEADTAAWLGFIRALPIEIDEEPMAQQWSHALPVARTHGLSFYDSCYLELALRRNLRLATLDERLTAAAKAAGVRLV